MRIRLFLAAILAALTFSPMMTSAAMPATGVLIKASGPAVYWYASNGKRYVFPNEKTYFSWFQNFNGVQTITDAELASVMIGGNVTYKPGVKMVKITTDNRVYAVDAGGTLRWVKDENVASALYGTNWSTKIEDIPDAFFVNYKVGSDISTVSDFSAVSSMAGALSIDTDLNARN